MPRIRWKDLPPALRDHLFERLREREISARVVEEVAVEGRTPVLEDPHELAACELEGFRFRTS